MNKHAYLIIAHNNWEQLHFLIDVLDDPRNDFFILIDSKASDFNQARFLSERKYKNLYFVEPINIIWGDYTQIVAEFSLLKAATSSYMYSYYHLISGSDMPLKNQDYIHNFFIKNDGYEFVDFDSFDDISLASARTRYYYFLQKQTGRKRISVTKILQKTLILIQQLIHINRSKSIESFLGKGSNWFSITDNFARYIVNNENFINKYFTRTFCCDEVFIQTLLKKSPYKNNWYGFTNDTIQYQNLRYNDWNRGKPYTFRKDEFFSLTKSPYLFARKFSNDIISDDILQHFTQKTPSNH